MRLWTSGRVQTLCGRHPGLKITSRWSNFQWDSRQNHSHIWMRGQKQETNIFCGVLDVCVDRSALPEIPSLSKLQPEAIRRSSRWIITSREAEEELLRNWDLGFALSFLFSHQRKLQACDKLYHRTHYNEELQRRSFFSLL